MKKLVSIILVLVIAGIQLFAQEQDPVVAVRFNNPQLNCQEKTYCVDVEFRCNQPGMKLFGMNVRFFYDDDVLEYTSMGSFAGNYSLLGNPEILNGGQGSGEQFGIEGPLEWVNGAVQLVGPANVILGTNEWTRLYSICFHVDIPGFTDYVDFCPSLIWDLEINPNNGGYLVGDDGVVITLVVPGNPQNSMPAKTVVDQFNWMYYEEDDDFGYPVEMVCVPTNCGVLIPVANWSLYLGIGLMVVLTLFIYRRRIS